MKTLILPSWKKPTCEAITLNFPNVELRFAKLTEIEFKFQNGKIEVSLAGFDLKNFDFVWLSSTWTTRDVAYAIHLYLEFHKVKHTKVEFASSKITDQITIALCGIHTPNTWYKPGMKNRNYKDYYKEIENICAYPMIMKDKLGATGNNVYLIPDRNELREKYGSSSKTVKFMIQGFIPNDYEWGLIVANGKIVSVEKKYAALGEHRNNVHMGGSEEFLKLEHTPKNIQDIAIKTADCLGLDWCRVDILQNKITQELYVLETNRFPGLTLESSEMDAATDFLENLTRN